MEVNFKDATAQVVQDVRCAETYKKGLERERRTDPDRSKQRLMVLQMTVDMYHGVGLDT